MCCVLKVHRSGFYAWLKQPQSDRTQQDRYLLKKIRESYDESNGVYGSPRVHRDLIADGIRIGRKRVARVMLEHQIKALRSYKKRRYKAGKPAVVAPNLLEQDFRVQAPNQAWLTDITYLRCKSGWAYLAAIMDLYSHKIVGWSA